MERIADEQKHKYWGDSSCNLSKLAGVSQCSCNRKISGCLDKTKSLTVCEPWLNPCILNDTSDKLCATEVQPHKLSRGCHVQFVVVVDAPLLYIEKSWCCARGDVEDGRWTGGQTAISGSGSWRLGRMGPEGVFPVSPLLSMSGLSGIFLIARPAHSASSVSGCKCSDSVLMAPPSFSGMGDFDRPAWEWDLNIIYSRGGMVQHFLTGLVFPLAGQRWRPSPAEKPENRKGIGTVRLHFYTKLTGHRNTVKCLLRNQWCTKLNFS